ncbi:flagellar export protein FliJ [Ectothiorhodospira lacustris]|uniref:flagellar export protein FliJ n=1 Tax=Ectothiorhodospira lacustris TaxID=2899127 RepID=UPI001EE7A56F|nr:flagellar export protein FliJ [Ectothiorhodospira lacustris]MCG5499526.1 flagellar export protein FliJ [Ectothiorhodospira lacustris]MCG5511104.1 flagellar export protein FliJ [Ectothiorhodospira lacustris]MCG5522888.1 flagellar export protein FliJ [Ectothiorhodospira lacustris]
MNRSKRMEPVVQVADNRQQLAAQRLGQSQQALEDRMARLEELSSYRDEYAQRFESQSGAGMTGVSVRDYRLFLHRLNEAIEQQARMVAAARHELEMSRGRWVEASGKTKALNRVVEQFQQEERRAADRREQAEQDDRNGRRHRRFE